MGYQTAAKKKILFKMKEDFVSNLMEEPAGDYPLHTHEHYEMEMVVRGSGYQYFNDVKFPVNYHDIYLVRPNDCHQYHSEGLTFRRLEVKPGVLPKWVIRNINALQNPVVYHLTEAQFKTFDSLMRLVEEEINTKRNNFLETATLLCELIFTYFFRLDSKAGSGKGEDFVTKIIYFLEHNKKYTEKVSLEEIAAYTGYSKFYTSSMFRKLYGGTIQDFIITLRIEYAQKLLAQTDYSIIQIAIECGFSSASNFYPQFEKIVGCSPLAYKKAALAKEQDEIKSLKKKEGGHGN